MFYADLRSEDFVKSGLMCLNSDDSYEGQPHTTGERLECFHEQKHDFFQQIHIWL